MLIRRLPAALMVMAFLLLALGAPAVAAGPVTRMVDDDGHASAGNCGSTAGAYSTIQSAVNASHAGDRVVVCPGTYAHKVVIGPSKHGLTLIAFDPWTAVIRRPTVLPGSVPLVNIQAGADNVSVWQFTLLFPAGNSCDSATTAAIMASGQNDSVRGNRIRTSPADHFGSCGFQSGIVVAPAAMTAASTRVIPAGFSTAASAFVGYNLIAQFQIGGIVVEGNSQASVYHNSLRYGHLGSGPTCSQTSTSSIFGKGRSLAQLGLARPAGTVLTALDECFAFGIVFLNGAMGDATGNAVFSGNGNPGASSTSPAGSESIPALAVGISSGLFGPAGMVSIDNNLVGLGTAGIAFIGATSGEASGNVIYRQLSGVDVEASSGLDIGSNSVHAGGVGITVDAESAGSSIHDNTATGNLSVDCQDQSSGAGTAGTANTWAGDIGNTSSPQGICAPQP